MVIIKNEFRFVPTSLFRNIIIYTLLVLSIIAIGLIYIFQEYRLPLWINTDVNNVNSFIQVLSVAYLSSFFFYFLVVRLKEIESEKVMYPFIADYT
jgi:uncharacterized protein involved in cysteine biosynthesis